MLILNTLFTRAVSFEAFSTLIKRWVVAVMVPLKKENKITTPITML